MFVEGMLECTTMCALAPSSSSLREGKKVGERVKWGGGRKEGREEGRKVVRASWKRGCQIDGMARSERTSIQHEHVPLVRLIHDRCKFFFKNKLFKSRWVLFSSHPLTKGF